MEIDSYIHCISAFVKLAQSEYALLTEIIPEHHQKKTFDSLIQVTVTLSLSLLECSCSSFTAHGAITLNFPLTFSEEEEEKNMKC